MRQIEQRPARLDSHDGNAHRQLKCEFGRDTVLIRRDKIRAFLSPNVSDMCGEGVPTGETQRYCAFRKMTGAYFDAFHAGETNAIERMIDFYGGAGTFAGWPQRVRDYAVETTPVNLLDWASAYGFCLTPALLASVTTPTLVVWGEASHPAAKRANELLGQCIPDAAVATIAGAAHFMITTHAKQLADLIARHVAYSAASAR